MERQRGSLISGALINTNGDVAGVPDGNYGHGPFVAEVLGATPPGGHVTRPGVGRGSSVLN